MHADIIELREFYATTLGHLAERSIFTALQPLWPKLPQERLVGIVSLDDLMAACAAQIAGVAKVVRSGLDRLAGDPEALAKIPHVEYVREAGSEGIELVMWLIARGAMADVAGGPAPKVAHRCFHVPASTTAVGHLILENG